MQGREMTDEENYAFDVGGFLIVPQILKASDIQACNEAIDNGVLAVPSTDEALPDAFAQLQDHPVLTGYLDQLTFDGYHIDGLPSLVDASEGSQLSGGNEPREPSRAYIHQNEVRFSQGIIAIWALTDVEEGDGGFCFVPASHKSCVDTPDDLTRGTDDMGLVRQVTLDAGDLFICVESLLHGVKPWKSSPRRLLAFTFAAEQAQRMWKQKTVPPDWADELSPEQKAVVAPWGRPDAPPVLETNGQSCTLRKETGVYHPSIYARNPDSGINEREFYQWDLCGHLVLLRLVV